MLSVDAYQRILSNYFVSDCAVRSRRIFVFLASRWYSDDEVEREEQNGDDPSFRDKRALTFFRDKCDEEKWAITQFRGWGSIRIGAATRPLNQLLAIEIENSRVHVGGSGAQQEEILSPSMLNSPDRGSITKIKTLNGYAYVCGGNRSFGRRLGNEVWMTANPDIPHERGKSLDEGFDDFDGFSDEDIYAAGGKGDVWHFDGTKWRQVAFPTNAYVESVCCGADGNVYIACYEGLTFMGRNDQWKKIHDGGIYLGWKDMVWYEDRAWCTNENGLWTIHKGKVELVTGLPSQISVCAGSLYTNDGVLLMGGLGGAAFREGGEWHSIYTRALMEKQLRERDGRA